ncbi:MAG: hypothetical protein CMA10_00460 [Euryarchaeota archaeon]|nr:hypothetical protein [Euryarchaeota archaeon]
MDEGDYGENFTPRERKLNGQLEKIYQSASYKLSQHLVKVAENPYRVLALPISAPWIIFNTLGWKGVLKFLIQLLIIPLLIPWFLFNMIFKSRKADLGVGEEKKTAKECIVIFSDECLGGTHLQRALAIETFIRQNRKNIQVIHITLESQNQFPQMNDSLVYNMPSRPKIPGMNPKNWNGLTENILDSILQMYDPKYFIFDGKYPFRGLLNSISRFKQMNRYWIQSTFKKVKTSNLPNGSFEIFDAIIHPTMTRPHPTSEIHLGRSGQIFTAPMVMKPQKEAYTKQDFIDMHDLPSDTLLVFFNVNNRTTQSLEIIEYMLKQESVHIITNRYNDTKSLHHPRFQRVQWYGLAEMFQIADVAIVDSNIYSLHSAIYSNTPSLCLIRSQSEVKQFKTHFNELNSTFLTLEPGVDSSILIERVECLIDPDFLTRMRGVMSQNKLGEGVRQFVDLIHEPSEVNK